MLTSVLCEISFFPDKIMNQYRAGILNGLSRATRKRTLNLGSPGSPLWTRCLFTPTARSLLKDEKIVVTENFGRIFVSIMDRTNSIIPSLQILGGKSEPVNIPALLLYMQTPKDIRRVAVVKVFHRDRFNIIQG